MSRHPKEAAATKAFLASAGHTFNGSEIAAFTPQRQAVATEMGMAWPYIGAEDMREVKMPPRDGEPVTLSTYKQAYKDTIIAMWLCSMPVSRVFKAERLPDEAMSEAWAWAEKIELNQNTALAGEALFVWIMITNEISASKGQPTNKDKDTEGEPQPGEC